MENFLVPLLRLVNFFLLVRLVSDVRSIIKVDFYRIQVVQIEKVIDVCFVMA